MFVYLKLDFYSTPSYWLIFPSPDFISFKRFLNNWKFSPDQWRHIASMEAHHCFGDGLWTQKKLPAAQWKIKITWEIIAWDQVFGLESGGEARFDLGKSGTRKKWGLTAPNPLKSCSPNPKTLSKNKTKIMKKICGPIVAQKKIAIQLGVGCLTKPVNRHI